jgi:hypothetical protein
VSVGKAKGTRFESAIVAFLRDHGWTHADRVPLSGSRDRGDVTLGPGSPVIESKNQNRHSLAEWLDEAEQEAAHADAPFGVAWVKRRGHTSPGKGYVIMSGEAFAALLKAGGW